MTTEVSRKTLYEAVWQKPATYVAKEYGISGVALGKICRRHNIPVPSRGYWARLKAGKEVERSPLSPPSNTRQSTVFIQGMPPTLKNPAVEVAIGLVEERLANKRLVVAALEKTDAVPTTYGTGLAKRLKRGQPNVDGQIAVRGRAQFRVEVSPSLATRVVDLANRLVSLAAIAELKLQPTERGIGFLCDDEIVFVEIIEKRDRRPHVLTDKESRELDSWNKKRSGAKDGGSPIVNWDKPRIAEWDYVPSGRLEIRLDGTAAYDGLRRRFGDGSSQRVEDILCTVILGVAACAAAAKVKRQERTRREQEMEQARAERTEVERKRALDTKRKDFLGKVLADWREAKNIDEFLEDFFSRHTEEAIPKPVQQFLDWSAEHAELLRQGQSADVLSETFQEYPLMDDDMDTTGWLRRMP